LINLSSLLYSLIIVVPFSQCYQLHQVFNVHYQTLNVRASSMNVHIVLFIFDYSLDILHNLICKFCFPSDTSSTDAEQTISDDLKKCKRFTMKIVWWIGWKFLLQQPCAFPMKTSLICSIWKFDWSLKDIYNCFHFASTGIAHY
jgi:hypothetical protein